MLDVCVYVVSLDLTTARWDITSLQGLVEIDTGIKKCELFWTSFRGLLTIMAYHTKGIAAFASKQKERHCRMSRHLDTPF